MMSEHDDQHDLGRAYQELWGQDLRDCQRIRLEADFEFPGWKVWWYPFEEPRGTRWFARKDGKGKPLECSSADELHAMIRMAEDIGL
jgi:hypothetical protein